MSGRSTGREIVAAVALAATIAACQKAPVVGAKAGAVQGPAGPKIELTSIGVNATNQVVVAYTLTKDGAAVTGADAATLKPAFTLAALGKDPVNPSLPTWRSLLLTGAETVTSHSVAPPGTPAASDVVVPDALQPGVDVGGTVAELGGGNFTYTYSAAVGAFQASETLRAGAFLRGTTGSALTTSTCDGASSAGMSTACGVQPTRQLVVDEACDQCHGAIRAHGGSRWGTRICVTCHTYLNADPNTVDPAALALAITGTPAAQAAPATTATNPNPLEFARLVHRIHRGKNLPTLYKANQAPALSWTDSGGVAQKTIAGEAPPLGVALTLPGTTPTPASLPLPFAPSRTATNPSLLAQKFSVIAYESNERIFGQVLYRTDNGHTSTDGVTTNPPQAAKVVRGINFPRDYRDCEACHPRQATATVPAARDAALLDTTISRRTCQGCHPDVWFGTGVPDPVHVAHPGGPQVDDSACANCHGATATLAPTTAVHVALIRSANYNTPKVEIASVTNFTPGAAPTIKFRVSDLDGPLFSLAAPPPLASVKTGSPVPRSITSMTLGFMALAGNGKDFLTLGTTSKFTDSFATVATTSPVRLAMSTMPAADADGWITYTFGSLSASPSTTDLVPSGASGTWMVYIELSRAYGSTTAPAPYYDSTVAPQGKFAWPYTGENITEAADTAFTWVSVEDGGSGGTHVQPRREIVDGDKCRVCHYRIQFHATRTRPEYCPTCHAPDYTDWSRRQKYAAGDAPSPALVGAVNLGATFDGIEERSDHMKVLFHRIHTGGRSGPASLQLTPPYTGGGSKATSRFRDMGEFPGDLSKCTLCHSGTTYQVESVPTDASGTWANETPTILHAGTTAHGADEVPLAPVTSACMGCHATAYAQAHTARYTTNGTEQCASCHGAKGSYSVERTHGLPTP